MIDGMGKYTHTHTHTERERERERERENMKNYMYTIKKLLPNLQTSTIQSTLCQLSDVSYQILDYEGS